MGATFYQALSITCDDPACDYGSGLQPTSHNFDVFDLEPGVPVTVNQLRRAALKLGWQRQGSSWICPHCCIRRHEAANST